MTAKASARDLATDTSYFRRVGHEPRMSSMPTRLTRRGSGVGTKTELMRLRLCWAEIVAAVAAGVASTFNTYHPERYYMRGPGPKALAKLGEGLRTRTDKITQEPLPEQWLVLMRTLKERESKRTNRHVSVRLRSTREAHR